MKKKLLKTLFIIAGISFTLNVSAQTWQTGGNNSTKTDTLGSKTNQDVRIITNNASRILIKKTGNVGIGTISPTSKLDVNGQLTIDQKNFGGYGGLLIKGNIPGSNYPNIAFSVKNNAGTPQDIIAGYIQGVLTNNVVGSEAMDLGFYTSQSGVAGLSSRLYIKDNGYVGIGTSSPFTNFVVNSGTNGAPDRGIWSAQYSGGNLGAIIGGRRSRGTETAPLAVGTSDYGVALLAQNFDGTNYIQNGSIGYRITGNAAANNIPGEWYIGTSDGDDVNPYNNNHVRMVVQSTGNVGIGTTSPAAILDVNGDAKINGLTVGRGSGNVISNTAVGNGALGNNVSGFFNTAVGQSALASATSNDNVAVGRFTLISTTTGNGNTAIGSGANPASATGAEANTTILGFLASTSSGVSNAVQIGNSSVTSVKAANNIVIVSDGRFKKNIEANVPGLDFISKLNPVTYNYDIKGLDKFKGMDVSSATNKTVSEAALNQYNQAVEQKEKIRYSGFVAQDVEKAAGKLGYDFSGVYKPQNDKDPYGLSYSDFVVPLVKAVQELNSKNESLEKQNAALLNQLNDMQQCVQSLCENATSKSGSSASSTEGNMLFQNQPNPFNQSTIIRYNLSPEHSSGAIVIRDLSGNLVKSIAVRNTGKSQVTVNANELVQGTYTYTLEIAGGSVDTKLMVIVK